MKFLPLYVWKTTNWLVIMWTYIGVVVASGAEPTSPTKCVSTIAPKSSFLGLAQSKLQILICAMANTRRWKLWGYGLTMPLILVVSPYGIKYHLRDLSTNTVSTMPLARSMKKLATRKLIYGGWVLAITVLVPLRSRFVIQSSCLEAVAWTQTVLC